MVFIVPKYQIVYAPVPKAACTSLKRAMFKLQHGTEYAPDNVDGQKVPIQSAFPTQKFDANDFAEMKDPWLFAVLRDPASRVLSTWSNKVMAHKRLAAANQFRRGKKGKVTSLLGRVLGTDGLLDPFPSIETFILRLDDYYQLYAPVRHHTASVTTFLGDDFSVYDRIYTISEIPQLEADIRARTGVADFSVPKSNSSPSEIKVTLDDLSDQAFDALMTWLASEYDLLKQWFVMPSRENRNMQQTGTI